MRTSTMLNHRDRLDELLADVWAKARSFSLTHDDVLDEENKVLATAPKGFPQHAREYLRGRQLMRLDVAYHHDLVWELARHDGVSISKWEDLTNQEQEEFRRFKRQGRYVWKHSGKPV